MSAAQAELLFAPLLGLQLSNLWIVGMDLDTSVALLTKLTQLTSLVVAGCWANDQTAVCQLSALSGLRVLKLVDECGSP